MDRRDLLKGTAAAAVLPLQFLTELNLGQEETIEDMIRPVFKMIGLDEASVGELAEQFELVMKMLQDHEYIMDLFKKYLVHIEDCAGVCPHDFPKNYGKWIKFCAVKGCFEICEASSPFGKRQNSGLYKLQK